ncbi:toll/interleukin-1 receptor domain-containing protein [Catellatospora sp. NPDC049111]|uniref:toll/interleukin-1 receptor domain-containing protein n=1 Tax=Catellatospora sp. NPDC049111 TaxID=3155271 RepID=UPI0033D0516D
MQKSEDNPHRHAVFISFRNGDGEWAAVALDMVLKVEYGDENVFRSSRSIRSGYEFTHELQTGLRTACAVLVVIGRQWLSITDDTGNRKIDQVGDWVRREVGESLVAGIPVIPVLVDGATLPRAAELPPDISALSVRQSVRLDRKQAESDIENMLQKLRQAAPGIGSPPPEPPERRPAVRALPRPVQVKKTSATARIQALLVTLALRGALSGKGLSPDDLARRDALLRAVNHRLRGEPELALAIVLGLPHRPTDAPRSPMLEQLEQFAYTGQLGGLVP